MLLIFKKEQQNKVNHLIGLMLPIIGTQLATMGMQFFDTSMSGQAGNTDLAGVAVGGNIWAPVATGITGILMAAMPLVANHLGAGEKEKIPKVIGQGLFLAILFSLLVLAGGYFALPLFLEQMELEPEVYRIAVGYSVGVGFGVLPFFMLSPLRSLVDTLGYTNLSMKLYLLALPINALMNYVLIFGKMGLPKLGGIGAGWATGLTFWLLWVLFMGVHIKITPFKEYCAWRPAKPSWKQIKEYLGIGIPMGFSIFLEVGIFCLVSLFIAKFGTAVLAAHQAAYNLSALVYMVPLSFSMALTIVIGVEYGAKRLVDARIYSRIGLQLSALVAVSYMSVEVFGGAQIAAIYSSDREVCALIQKFLWLAVLWQFGDIVGAPIQGILRGYKDVNATFWSNVLAFWIICMPVGLYMDYMLSWGAFSYWYSLVLGVFCSSIVLVLRLRWIERKLQLEAEQVAES